MVPRAAGRYGVRRCGVGVGAECVSPYERGKHAQRDVLLAERARETGAAIAYLNVVGGQDALVFDGASVVVDGQRPGASCSGGVLRSVAVVDDMVLSAVLSRCNGSRSRR